jgi:Family of unknown function (DUF6510)
MEDADLRLDGNSAAELLGEIFVFDVTSAEAVCAGCGAIAPVGGLGAYGLAMGAILRCRKCDTAVIRVSRTRRGYWIDLTGTTVLRIDSSPLSAS